MAERERRITPPYGGVFVPRTRVLSADDVRRALTRIAHEVIERNAGLDEVVVIGLQTGGVRLAARLADELERIAAVDRPQGDDPLPIPFGTLDVAFYRDDIGLRPVMPEAVTDIPVDLGGKVVVLVDDVLFTGRTIRAALDAIIDLGRPQMIQLAILIDRGHRELPIRPDFVGKNLPTSRRESVAVRLREHDGEDRVVIEEPEEA